MGSTHWKKTEGRWREERRTEAGRGGDFSMIRNGTWIREE